jgi:hypothetical protein
VNHTIRQIVRRNARSCVLALSCAAFAACGDDQGGGAGAPDAGASAGSGGTNNTSNTSGSGGASAGTGGSAAAGHAAGGAGGSHAGSGGHAAGSGDNDAGTADDAGGATSSFAITLSTGPCFGACPEYDVTIDETGSVMFDGHENTHQQGEATKQVPAADAAAIYDALVIANYWNLHDRYRTEADGCESVATDHPTHTWNVTAEGKPAKMVEDYLGCMGAPGVDKLRDAEALLVQNAGISAWIGAGPKVPHP